MYKDFTIECKDIILREYRVEDIDAMYAITCEPEVLEFLPDWNAPKEQRLDWLVNYEIGENKQFLKAVAEGGAIGELRLRLAVISKETGEFIGWCCSGIKEELPPPNREIMYAISNKYSNKGYTTQAVQGMVNYLFENTDVEELVALALTHNIPSNRVIQKSGFESVGITEIEDEKYHYYRLCSGK
ncbi:RimJ/RimL family protein N-acetyltransferase [Paenibacillus anaericanus]|uniref:N-acetyltransferase n=1 Tax=Paenibacillus anaericanus TaxID=170367 RepID=A0A433Y815_9BACL|nr:GNAT family N-acetyltransferase [Paenibacillus anaericanus]MDQ0089113.1 RimJ/RimL family protein N-acetyltransferase [Paenibacillus anaericanus]RUT45567.1 N-acetyltransferase [Paenibacillus anaericanus]